MKNWNFRVQQNFGSFRPLERRTHQFSVILHQFALLFRQESSNWVLSTQRRKAMVALAPEIL